MNLTLNKHYVLHVIRLCDNVLNMNATMHGYYVERAITQRLHTNTIHADIHKQTTQRDDNMAIMYFEGLTLENDIKQRYKELAKQYHPDRGGCLETMKIINTQYERVITGAYQKAGKSITEIDELLANDAVLHSKLNSIVHLEGLSIELCGSWLWVTGDTRTHKETLKSNKFLWAAKKSAWYWRAQSKKSYNRMNMSLDEIRFKHGSHAIQRRERVLVG